MTEIAINARTTATYQIVGPGGPNAGIPLFGGELLLAPTPAPIWISGRGTHSADLPASSSLVGLTVYTQGARIDDTFRGSIVVLLNALDAHLAF